MNHSFYIEKIDQIGDVEIWLVDGAFVRNNVNIEFTNWGTPFQIEQIPQNQIWLDKEFAPNERTYFIDAALIYYRLSKEGTNHSDAINASNLYEQAERDRSADKLKILKHNHEDAKLVHKNQIGMVNNELKIYVVNGRLVRSNFYINFTEGGHHEVYSFVPENEIWIDDDLGSKERPYVIYHEIFEYLKMKEGYTYHQAHRMASHREWEFRSSKKEVNWESEFDKIGVKIDGNVS